MTYCTYKKGKVLCMKFIRDKRTHRMTRKLTGEVIPYSIIFLNAFNKYTSPYTRYIVHLTIRST